MESLILQVRNPESVMRNVLVSFLLEFVEFVLVQKL